MLPFNNLIPIKKELSPPVYIQICNGIIRLIQEGILKKGSQLPGSRALSDTLNIHRKTAIAAYEELKAQGWIKIEPSRGAYISDALPEISPKSFQTLNHPTKKEAGFYLKKNEVLSSDIYKKTALLEINDGLPDERLAPMESLARSIRSVLKGQRGKLPLSYSDIEGNQLFRNELCAHLNETRGFDYSYNNIFITRGTIMGLYLSLAVILEKGDNVIVGTPGYRAVNLIIQNLGANLIKVKADEGGLDIAEVERICMQKKVRVIYVTPHHHYPTTVTMPPERRIALLSLAQKYKIAIIEDDYDYDYHYRHSPFLPLATADPSGLVVYIGSFSKTFSPAFRVGYIAAPENFIYEITKLRRIIDRQGDSILEQALAEMFKLGEIKSHLKKSHNAYLQRRDVFCKLLNERLGSLIDFEIPEGGMAIWAKFNKSISLIDLSKQAAYQGLHISNGVHFNSETDGLNAIRLGFASLDFDEIDKAISLLEKSINQLRA